jgi:hypothetical protein
MSNYNKLFLSGGDRVFITVANTEGLVVNFTVDSALIELPMLVDNQIKIIKQWYKNEVLKKIEVDTGVTKVNVDTKVVVDEPTIEMGVPGGSQKINGSKKNRRNK